MWTDSILKKFKLRVAGDEGENDNDSPSDPPEDNNNNNDDGGDKNDPPSDDDKGDDLKIDELPESAQKYIKSLRAENAKRRKDFNNMSTKMEKFEKGFKTMFGDEDDDEDPEKKLDKLTGDYHSTVSENAVLRLALENGISGAENVEYFEFLMNKSLGSLDEGEELTEEMVAEVIEKCSSKIGGKGKANTSTKGDGKKKPQGNEDEVSQEEFDQMGMVARSALYQKNESLYNKLMQNSTVR